MAKKAKKTPIGKAVFPRLQAGNPDTKFDTAGVYKVDLELGPEEAATFIEELETVQNEYYEEITAQLPKVKAKKVKKADLPYEEEEDGTFRFKFKMKAKVETKTVSFTQQPALFDAKGTAISPEVVVRGGSKIRVAYEAIPYDTPLQGVGVTLRLKAVQVLELAQRGASTAADYDFEEEEGLDITTYEPEEPEVISDDGLDPQLEEALEGDADIEEPEEGDF